MPTDGRYREAIMPVGSPASAPASPNAAAQARRRPACSVRSIETLSPAVQGFVDNCMVASPSLYTLAGTAIDSGW